MIREFKICVICNKYNTNEVLKECRTCGNFYHQQCFKKKHAHASLKYLTMNL